MPSDPTLEEVAAAAGQLLDRVARERKRLATDRVGPTEMVGGWARIGAALDRFLRAAFVAECAACGRDPVGELRRIAGAVDLARGTAGQFAHALNVLGVEGVASVARLDALVRDVASAESVLGDVIELRNALVHSRREPDAEEALPVLDSLDSLLRGIPWGAEA